MRNLVIVFGDQLNAESSAFDGFERTQDAALMMEVQEEATYVPQHKLRLIHFFSAMRHFRDELRARGREVYYTALEDHGNGGDFAAEIPRRLEALRPEAVIATQPGDYRVEQLLRESVRSADCRLEIRADRHFLCRPEEFVSFAEDRHRLLLETFYRRMRRRHDVLVHGDAPIGGRWNYDKDNRESFGRHGPGDIAAPFFPCDAITREVATMIGQRFPNHPARLDTFDYPVTREQARAALADFVTNRLPNFGRFQDAMATGHPYLYHSRLSCVLNLHLLDPREAIEAVVAAFHAGRASINSTEGFVRQILGWREYVRGVYWWKMPDYAEMNALDAQLPMPAFMWTAETEMNCVRQSVSQLIEHAYAHHIQRLMVLAQLAMLLGVHPYDVHRWHLSMFIDAIDWVSLPNTLGMSQFGDGGIVGTKPYAASGNYINRMSDYCEDCRFDPKRASGDRACPFTTLYWDFLARNQRRIRGSRQMMFQIKNLARKREGERRAIFARAEELKAELTRETIL